MIVESHEKTTQFYLPKRQPLIIRCDGRSFNSLTSGFNKPFDMIVVKSLHDMGIQLCKQIQGCKLAYTHSDEISFLLTDYEKLETVPWFDRDLSKIVSITAGLASVQFNKYFMINIQKWWNELSDKDKITNQRLHEIYNKKLFLGVFDCRAFTVPVCDINKCFMDRQKYAIWNFNQAIKEDNKDKYEPFLQKGVTIIRSSKEDTKSSGSNWIIDYNVPFFYKEINYIENAAKLGGYGNE